VSAGSKSRARSRQSLKAGDKDGWARKLKNPGRPCERLVIALTTSDGAAQSLLVCARTLSPGKAMTPRDRVPGQPLGALVNHANGWLRYSSPRGPPSCPRAQAPMPV
jgi:hypothetical protein